MLQEMFGTAKPIIGVIHLLPLPGSHRFDGHMEPIFLRAEQEAAALASGGVDGIIIENFFDAPFAKNHVDTAVACSLSLVCQHVKSICSLPIGINILRNDGLTAMAVAVAAEAEFIRVNVYSGTMLTDQGIIEGQANELLRYRRLLSPSKRVRIFADVMVKHASPLTPLADISQMTKDTVQRGLADAVIVSGIATGSAPDLSDLEAVREAAPNTPILIGSGTTRENVRSLLTLSDGVIVASSLKRQGVLENPVDVERVQSLVDAVRQPTA
jgi:membrane complex biogenesis BtpA family protein